MGDIQDLISKKKKDTFRSLIFLAAALCLYFGLTLPLGDNINYLFVGLIMSLGIFAVIDLCLLIYRIKKGWYGDNGLEVREIADFVSEKKSIGKE